MIEGLVSVITPCYNGARYLGNFFMSLLNQNYKKIEIIFIDDGSTDGTRKVAYLFKNKFEKLGVSFQYIYQKNQGQAVAINTGLEKARGEYIIWPDSDDWLTPDSIEKRVDFLKEHSDYNIVACAVALYDENDMLKPQRIRKWECEEKNIFYDVLLSNVPYYSGIYMVKANCLFKALDGKRIMESKIGQNWQLLLPITYENKCYLLKEILHNVTIHEDSHSHSIKGKKVWLERIGQYRIFMQQLLENINMPKEEVTVALQKFEKKCDLQLFLKLICEEGVIDEREILLFEKCFVDFDKMYGKRIWLWGIGKYSCCLKYWLERAGNIKIAGFVVSNKNKNNECGCTVLDFEAWKREGGFILIPIAFYSEVVNLLIKAKLQYGIDYVYPNYRVMIE